MISNPSIEVSIPSRPSQPKYTQSLETVSLAKALKEIAEQDAKAVTPSAKPSDLCNLLKAKFQGGFKFDGVTGTNIVWDKDGFVNKEAVKYVVKAKNA